MNSIEMLRFTKKYAAFTLLLFVTEVLIAVFVHDRFVRPYLGDILVVVFLYCLVRTFVNLPVLTTALIVWTFAFLVEFLQYINLVEKLGLQKSTVARIVIGTSFEWLDLLAYSFGAVIVLLGEMYVFKRAVI